MKLPRPVGVQHFYLEDESRISAAGCHARDIACSVFYPGIENAHGRPLAYVDRFGPAPYLRVRGRPTLKAIDALFADDAKDFACPVQFVILAGWQHGDFSDSPCFVQLTEQPNGARRFFQFLPEEKPALLAELLANFFGHFLRDAQLPLIAGENIRYRAAR